MRIHPEGRRFGRVVTALAMVAATGCASVVGAGAAAATTAAPACTWQLHRLPTPAGMQPLMAAAANGYGAIVGSGLTLSGVERGVVWTAEGKIRLLSGPDGEGAYASDINRSGVVAGNYWFDGNLTKPLVWVNGRPITLALPAGSTDGGASQVSDSGLVTGYIDIDGTPHGATWSLSTPGVVHDYGAAYGRTILSGVSADGTTVVGSAELDDQNHVALISRNGSPPRPIPGLDPAFTSGAGAINGPYLLGAGRLTNGSNGNGSPLLWKTGTPTPTVLPADFSVSDVSSTGIVTGEREVDSPVVSETPMVWEAGRVSMLPLIDASYQGSSVGVVQGHTIVGLLLGGPTSNWASVTWTRTCS